MSSTFTRATRLIGAGLGAAALGWLGYAAIAWRRYGKPSSPGDRDVLLDRFMPTFEVSEQHETFVDAPADVTYATARTLDLLHSPLVRALLRTRELMLRGHRVDEQLPRGLIDQMRAIGWVVLFEAPGRQIVLGAVTRPWDAHPEFRGAPPDEFLAFAEPSYVKIIWTVAVEPRGPTGSHIRSETRATTSDLTARRRFRRYWAMFSPGIFVIRSEGLRLVRDEAERRHRAEAAPVLLGT